MNNTELKKFAQQLSLWTELIIENGRTPFRRVDLFSTIMTAAGELQPPLIFWINRQSMMAGGILLLPEHDLDAELEKGRHCCEALGLKHFVTWETEQVRIWRIEGDKVQQHQRFELQNSDHPDSFRFLLGEVLEALKLLAVIGLVPNNKLSHHYLHNLFLTTLDHALPHLVNSYRSQRAEDGDSELADADLLASEANRMLLLQLLCLAWYEKLPSAILPEKLERALQISAPELPEELRRTLFLNVTSTPPELPLDAAVAFHHLLLRLRQLSWRQNDTRALNSIRVLITGWFENQSEPLQAEVLLYPETTSYSDQTKVVISGAPSLLASTRLLENLYALPAKQLQHGSAFELELDNQQALSMAGNVFNSRMISREERQHYLTLLRKSWPNRRFRISGNNPLWYWELIHLLGLGKEQKTLSLTIPLAALLSPEDDLLWELLFENYTLTAAAKKSSTLIEIDLTPELHSSAVVDIIYEKQLRQVTKTKQLAVFRNQLLLALQLPENLYRILSEKLTWSGDEKLTREAQSGLEVYLESHFWQFLRNCLNVDFFSTTEENSEQLMALPRPDIFHLKELGRLQNSKDTSSKDSNQLLADILQVPEILSIDRTSQPNHQQSSPKNQTDKELKNELIQQLKKAGIPAFPEQYLYFLDNPETTTFFLTPPLLIKSEFLGEFELVDAEGQSLHIYGDELCKALMLCSELQRNEVELPTDLNQLSLLQQQYWKDMQQLQKKLNSLCHSQLKSSKAADKLAKKIWKALSLPKLP